MIRFTSKVKVVNDCWEWQAAFRGVSLNARCCSLDVLYDLPIVAFVKDKEK